MTGAIRVGIVGFGVIGRRRAEALGDDEPAAVVDPAANAVPAGVARYPDTTTMCVAERPDVVVVATPYHTLSTQAMAALRAGSHVLIEKPAALSLGEFDDVAATAEAAGRRLWVGYNHRYHPGLARLMAEAASGRHGRVMFVRARYGHGGRVGYDREWHAHPELSGGGELMDQGGHLLDLIHSVLGAVPLSAALLRTAFWNMPVDDNAVLTLAGTGPRDPWATLELSELISATRMC